jgi:hypothetical protein
VSTTSTNIEITRKTYAQSDVYVAENGKTIGATTI